MTRLFIILTCIAVFPALLLADNEKYDIAYIWDTKLEVVLDYQEELIALLGSEEGRNLLVVGREGGEYGIVYNLDGTALASAQLMVMQNEILRKEGLAECFAIEDEGYYRLYNVSYGLGPNVEALKKLYSRIYNYLGKEVGKNLFIEKTDSDNYTLIYRRRGDRDSTYAVAKKHRKLLKSKKINTSITPEKNNPVVFGESSHLDDSTEDTIAAVVVEKSEKAAVPVVKIEARQVLEPAKVNVETQIDAQEVVNSTVENNIEQYIKQLRKNGKLSGDETTGWMVYDLKKGKSIVDINANQSFQAASMIKPFIALAFFHQANQKQFIYGPKSRAKMEAMIQRSDNAATNWVMRVAGGPSKVQEILSNHYGHIFKGTSIVEFIPSGGKTYKNRALPSDYVRYLQALWDDELPYGKEMRRLMSLPGRDRLYDGTPIPQGTLVYNKTGSTAHLCGDMGILVLQDKNGHRYPYALVGIIERSSRATDYGNWMLTRGNVIRQVSTIVYEEMKKEYRL